MGGREEGSREEGEREGGGRDVQDRIEEGGGSGRRRR